MFPISHCGRPICAAFLFSPFQLNPLMLCCFCCHVSFLWAIFKESFNSPLDHHHQHHHLHSCRQSCPNTSSAVKLAARGGFFCLAPEHKRYQLTPAIGSQQHAALVGLERGGRPVRLSVCLYCCVSSAAKSESYKSALTVTKCCKM